jgi:methylmalonyl-CoA/ethylmalonyl-CoA epimerase
MNAEFVTVGIRVKDLEKSIDFYVKLLGMKIVGKGKLEQTKGEWVELANEKSGLTLELNYYREDSPYFREYQLGEGLDHLTFRVDDLDKAIEEAKLSGYPVIDEHKLVNSRWVYIEDPNGIWIQLY